MTRMFKKITRMFKKIIGGQRACGKTTKLIEISSRLGAPILAPSQLRARHIWSMAKAMGMEIPKPLSPLDLGRQKGRGNKILVDDIVEVLEAFTGCEILTASTSRDLRYFKNNKDQENGFYRELSRMPRTRIEKLRSMTTQEVAKLVNEIQSLELDGFCKSDCGDDDCLNPIPCIVRWLEEDIEND